MATAAIRQTGGSVRVTLWVLLVVYIFNFIDRQIANILAEPIAQDLRLSDTQIGLMTGLASRCSIPCSACRSRAMPTVRAPAARG